MDENTAKEILKVLETGDDEAIEYIMKNVFSNKEAKDLANLIKNTSNVVKILVDVLLIHPEGIIRQKIAIVLGYFNEKSNTVIPALIMALENEPEISNAYVGIFEALSQFGEEATYTIPEILAHIDHIDRDYLKPAIICLGKIGHNSKDAIIKIISIMDSTKYAYIRSSCKRSLIRIAKKLSYENVKVLIDEYKIDSKKSSKVSTETKITEKEKINKKILFEESTIYIKKLNELEKKMDALLVRILNLENKVNKKKNRFRFFKRKLNEV